LEDSIADQANGGLGNYPSALCLPSGMPRMMTFGAQEYIITPDTTYILVGGGVDHTRRIFTDGRDWPKEIEPTFAGYSIGRWIDKDVDGVYDVLKELTGGRGPDACIDAVGMEAHGSTIDALYDRVKQAVRLEMDRAHVLRQALHCCRKGGTVSIPGVYGGFIDKIPFGAAFAKGLTLRMGQTHVHNYTKLLYERIERGEIDPSFVITHRVSLNDAPEMYPIFRDKGDECIKVVMRP